MMFKQTEFGFPCNKKTLIWGNFNIPAKQEHKFEEIYKLEEIDYKMRELYKLDGVIKTDHNKRAAVRSITPERICKSIL